MKYHTPKILLCIGLLFSMAVQAYPDELPEHLSGISEEAGALRFVAAVLPDKARNSIVTVTWNYTDTANFRYIRLYLQGTGFDTFDSELKSKYVYGMMRAGIDSIISRGKFIQETSAHDLPLAIQLDACGEGAGISVGIFRQQERIPVEFNLNSPGAIGITSSSRHTKILSEDIFYFPSDRNTTAPFESMNAMRRYLADSQDPVEGLWIYFDSKCDPLTAHMSERYMLATIRNGQGGYDIYYADGPKVMAKKGSLTPTINNATLDLQWMDAHGTYMADKDAHAELATGGTTIEFFFPALKSQVRYRRSK